MKGLIFILVFVALVLTVWTAGASAQCLPGDPYCRTGVAWTPQPMVQPGTMQTVYWTRPSLLPWNRWQVRSVFVPSGPWQPAQSRRNPNVIPGQTIIIR